MVNFTVGGRTLSVTMDEVMARMRGVEPEPIRQHLVEMHNTVYPPKQVLANMTGWDRQTFTTMEAQRVLTRLGFVCRRAGELPNGERAWLAMADQPDPPTIEHRMAAVEATLSVIQQALARLADRITELEGIS